MGGCRGPGDPDGRPRDEHPRVRGLLGPYVLGDLDPDEKGAVEEHLARCEACRKEERELREIGERLDGASIAASSAPPDLRASVLAGLPSGEAGASGDATGPGWGRPWAGRIAAGAGAVAVASLLFALVVAYYPVGVFGRTATAALEPTGLAPGAGGKLEVRGSGPNLEGNLEVWGMPATGPDEYYELWLRRGEGRVSAGTFTVDEEGWGRLSACASGANEGGLDGPEYQRVGITLEEFPEEPSRENARVVLGGDLQGP